MDIRAEFPDKTQILFEPKRYKILFGGRGGGKSHSVAKALLIQGMESRHRILCAREFQKSIADSVHKLLADQIATLKLDKFYEVQNTTILGKNGTEFIFSGLRHNIASIKSFEGITRVWVEEAHTVSRSSWETLIPTIREKDSEIWVTFNPEQAEDDTYQRFVVNPPPDAVVVKVGWNDNPFFPDVLEHERLYLKAKDPDAYLNVWEGHCREILEGAIFADELRAAKQDGRIGKVSWDPTLPVDTYWDLGFADATSIWFVQPIAHEFRVIDFFQDQLKAIQHYVKELQLRRYTYRTAYLPHDADHQTLAAGGRSVAQQVRAAGVGERVITIDRIPTKELGIAAARAVFPLCWFDESRCADGLQALRHYRYEVDPDTRAWSSKPCHDWSSHAADAFMQLGCSIRPENDRRTGRNHFVGFSNIADRYKPGAKSGEYQERYA